MKNSYNLYRYHELKKRLEKIEEKLKQIKTDFNGDIY